MRRYLFVVFFLIQFACQAQQISICSWNLKNFGKSKSDETIGAIARIVKPFDVVALQEIVAGTAGPQTVAKLVDELNRMGQQWDYAISPPTSGSSYKSERYAFLWKRHKVKRVGEPWLEKKYAQVIEREPYVGRFQVGKKQITIVNFHAITKGAHPEKEIKYFKFFPAIYQKDNLVFCGDFNLPESHSVFTPLKKQGYQSAMVKQKTSLRMRCLQDDCLASEYDNFFFNRHRLQFVSAGILHFYKVYDSLSAARQVSDHVPIFLNLII